MAAGAQTMSQPPAVAHVLLLLLASLAQHTVVPGCALAHTLPPPTPPTPRIIMAPCSDPVDQELDCFGNCGGPVHPGPNAGMLQFKRHPGSCLQGDPVTGVLTTTACNTTREGQRFDPSNGLIVVGHAHGNHACITASNRSCTIYSETNVTCEPGAPISLAPCVSDWRGLPGKLDPLQMWTHGGAYHEEQAIVLMGTCLKKNKNGTADAAASRCPLGVGPNVSSCLTASGSGPAPPVPPAPPPPPPAPAPPVVPGTLVMEQCHDPVDQELDCFGTCGGPVHPGPDAGMLQFKRHPGSCLQGDPVTGVLTTTACNTTREGQRFDPSNGLIVVGHAHGNHACITASNRSCTIYSETNVTCEPGAPISLAPCVSDWRGLPGKLDPLQMWTHGGAYHYEQQIVLVATCGKGGPTFPSTSAIQCKKGPGPNTTSCLTLTPKP